MENRNRFGFRDDDELIAVIVVLLLVAILAFYFIRGFGNRQLATDVIEEPIAVVDEAADGLTNSVAVDADAELPTVDVDADGELDVDVEAPSAELTAPEADTGIAVQPAQVATTAPIVTLPTNRFKYGAVLINGTGEPNTNVTVEISDVSAGDARVADDGTWSYVVPAGVLIPGEHNVVAIANDFRSGAQTFTLEGPEAPTLDANWNNTVTKVGQWEVSGRASADWEVAVGVADAEPVKLPTDENGNWRATVDLAEPGTYELEVFAVNPDGSVNFNASTGKNRIIVTEDGQPPVVADPAPAAVEDDGAAAQAEADAQAAAEAQAAAQAEADAQAAAEAEAAAQAEADAQAAAEAEAAAQAEADAQATAEAEAAAQAEAEAQAAAEAAAAEEAANTNLYQMLLSTGQHGTLLAAVDAAGLRETLEQQDQPLTVFAPTDAAFAALPSGAVDALIANPDALRGVLVEHVVAGEIPRAAISAETTSVTNLADHVLPVLASDESVNIAGSNVTQADIPASNGVIHAVDQVILPPYDGVQPVIDVEGVPIFKGTFLTVVGTAQPGSTLILTINGVEFGQQVIGDDGRFEISGDITDGDYIIKAFTLDSSTIVRSISDPVQLIVDNS